MPIASKTHELQRKPGYCAPTGGEGNCTNDLLGSWDTTRYKIRSLQQCVARCKACENCGYVSFSLAPAHRDCSWYARCDLDDLRAPPPTGSDFVTAEVKRVQVRRQPRWRVRHDAAARMKVAILTIAMGKNVRCGLVSWCESARRLANELSSDWDPTVVVIGSDGIASGEAEAADPRDCPGARIIAAAQTFKPPRRLK